MHFAAASDSSCDGCPPNPAPNLRSCRICCNMTGIRSSLTILLLWIFADDEKARLLFLTRTFATCAILAIFPAFYCWKFISTPAKLDAEANAALVSATRDLPVLTITAVQ